MTLFSHCIVWPHLVTEEVAPVTLLYADGVDQAATAVHLTPGQGLVAVEVCLGLGVGVVLYCTVLYCTVPAPLCWGCRSA